MTTESTPVRSSRGDEIVVRLAGLDIVLPELTVPRGSYVPWVISGKWIFIAGQGPRLNGTLVHAGQVGCDLTLQQAQAAARLCALNIVAQLNAACGGDLGKIVRVVRLFGAVNAGSQFTEHANVLNGASDLMHAVFQERGQHVRMAIGASSLPSNMAVEIEAVFEME